MLVNPQEALNAYRGRKVLVTGHSGFKGSWLCRWLDMYGAKVAGLSNGVPTSPSHHQLLNQQFPQFTVDIRDGKAVLQAVKEFEPEAVFHLAAQSLVRPSYVDPVETYATNVLGTLHVYEACRHAGSVKAIVSATTDKVYRNREWHWAYREQDELGGHDPYSSSKACAEILSDSYRLAFLSVTGKPGPLLATVRAGNVIGGGDWALDRLFPDIVRAGFGNKKLSIRSPASVRPWQHVLDPLFGYLIAGSRLLSGDNTVATAWNFGPSQAASITVRNIVESLQERLPDLDVDVGNSGQQQVHEAGLLEVDSSKARNLLGWRPVWEAEMLDRTFEWYEAFYHQDEVLTTQQIEAYMAQAASGS